MQTEARHGANPRCDPGPRTYDSAVPPTSPSRLRALTASVALAACLGLTAGCSDGGSDGDSASASSGSAAAAADAAGALLQSGLDQVAAGDEEAARTTFLNVLTLDPTNVYAHYNLGLIAQNRGQEKQALASYDDALAADPEFGPALYNKGILTESTDLDAAVELYRQAIAADDTFAPAFMRLGFALLHLGHDDEGTTYLAKGLQLDPAMADVKAPSYVD